MSLGCWAMAHGCPCQRRLHARVLSKPMLLGGAWLEPGEQRTLRSASVLNQWLGSSGKGDVEGFEDIFFGTSRKPAVFGQVNVFYIIQWHQARRRHLGHSGEWAYGERAVDGMATSSHWFILSSDIRWWCEAHSPAACYDWRSKWPKRIINVPNESLRVWRGMWSLAFEPTWIHAQCSACVFNLSLLAFCVFKATVRSQSPFLHGQCPANARAWCLKNKQCGNHSG